MIRPLTCLLFCAALAFPLENSEKLAELLNEANGLFRQANELSLRDQTGARDLYQRTALRLERIVREGGVRNGRLFYNLGNAYFRAGEIGHAILNYRRAEVYIPGDANLLQNLNQARKQRQDSFEDKQQTRILRTLLFWHYDLSPRARSWLFAIFSAVFWIGAALKLRRPHWIPRTGLIITGVLALLFVGSIVVEANTGRAEAGVILAQQVVARKGDGESYEPSFNEPLHSGTEFALRETRGDWHHIELPDGRECWIPAKSAGLVLSK